MCISVLMLNAPNLPPKIAYSVEPKMCVKWCLFYVINNLLFFPIKYRALSNEFKVKQHGISTFF